MLAGRSGTEEEYTELHQLLENISSYMHDFQEKKKRGETRAAALKRANDKRKGEEMRNAAMKSISGEI